LLLSDGHLPAYSPFNRSCPQSTGAPAANASFICDSTSTVCYGHSTTTANFSAARAACAATGGDLVHYQNGNEQLFVEAHMAHGRSLALTYWVRSSARNLACACTAISTR
jgi:hypothetical protein